MMMGDYSARMVVFCTLLISSMFSIARADVGALEIENRTVTSSSGKSVSVDFGWLTVPANRNGEDEGEIEIAFAYLQSEAENPIPPLVYLSGGPGSGSTHQIDNPEQLERWTPFLEHGDVILLDQRGCGRSRPSTSWRLSGSPDLTVFENEDNFRAHLLNIHRQARADLDAGGLNLSAYTTIESAHDVNDLRRALGIKQISICGFSYGTHLGLSVLRLHGEHIANAILVGVEGPDHTMKLPSNADVHLKKLAHLVARDPIVGPSVPDMAQLFQELQEQLGKKPLVVNLGNPETDEYIPVGIGPTFLAYILRRDLGDASDLPVFPRLLMSIKQGDPTLLRWFARKRAGILMRAQGMSILMDGASGASPERLARIRAQEKASLFGAAVNLYLTELSEIWQPSDVGAEFRLPLVSDVRTLFLTGSLDWNTPPHQAAEVRWGFSDSVHLTVENAGHEQIMTHPAIAGAMVDFLRGEDVSAVHAAWPPLKFVPLTGYDPNNTHPSIPVQ